MRCPTEPVFSETSFAEYDFDQSCAYSDDGFNVSLAKRQTLPHVRLGYSSAFGPVRLSSQSGDVAHHRDGDIRPLLSRAAFASAPSAVREIPGVVAASRLELPPAPTVSSGLSAVDILTGGLPRGALTEICGPASSGRTSLLLAAMANATNRRELCALVDAADCFDPNSAEAAGVDLDRLLWIRCSSSSSYETSAGNHHEHSACISTDLSAALHAKQRIGTFMPPAKVWYGRPPARSERTQEQPSYDYQRRHASRANPKSKPSAPCGAYGAIASDAKKYWAHRVDQALKATDLLLQAGGFGMVIVDLGNVPADIARRVPLTSWFRFRRAVENTPAVLVAIAQESCARTCASLVLQLRAGHIRSTTGQIPADIPSHARIFRGLNVTVEVLRSRMESPANEKKPPRPVRAVFDSRTQWVG